MRVEVGLRACAALLGVGLLLAPARPAAAQDANQAGLVITTGAGATTSYCVQIAPDETISGDEFLQRAGVTVSAEQSAIGATICSLNGTGCGFPAESCFCQCQGSPCTYWSYWRQDAAGAWQYASAGAGNTRVAAGDVEGWVWGEGTTDAAQSPPALTLAEICKAPAAAAAALDVGAAITEAVTQEITQAQTTAAPAGAVTPAGATTPGAAAQTAATEAAEVTEAAGGGPWALLGLAALVIIPVAVLLLLRGRKEA